MQAERSTRSGSWALVFLTGIFLVILALPLVFRSQEIQLGSNTPTLIILSPHNEAIRYEFSIAFNRWYEKQYGQTVAIDWRNIGGTSEIARYLSSQFTSAFRNHWTGMGKDWNQEVAYAFANPKIDLKDATTPALAREAREAFLASEVGIGVDLFFGGGEYDHSRQAAMGQIIPCGFRQTPEAASILDQQIPAVISGEKWYDPQDRWYGTTLSSFGICYNTDVLGRLANVHEPTRWRDLTQAGLFQTVALADPTKSGSVAKTFEMVIQQEMAEAVGSATVDHPDYQNRLGKGWTRGLNVIRQIAANTRYFTDSASKVPMDVASGNASSGMCIDFYGLFEAEWVAKENGISRMKFVSPVGGTTVSCDPISMLRGAPHRELALQFIRFCLSPEGQGLWGLKAGVQGGPVRYSLHRFPIRRDYYEETEPSRRSHPEMDPYKLAGTFSYHYEWTGKQFNLLRLLLRTMCLDTGKELRQAWAAIQAAGGPQANPEAMALLEALPEELQYANLASTQKQLASKLDEVRQAREWVIYFRQHYQQVCNLLENNPS